MTEQPKQPHDVFRAYFRSLIDPTASSAAIGGKLTSEMTEEMKSSGYGLQTRVAIAGGFMTVVGLLKDTVVRTVTRQMPDFETERTIPRLAPRSD